MAARPQLENGHLRIANELMEALARIRIPGEARQVLDVILRKTYGYKKKYDHIPLTQFRLATGLKGPHVVRAINKLLKMKLVTKKDNGGLPLYGPNKDFDTWRPLPKKVTVAQKGNNRCPKRNTQKKKENFFPPDSDEYRLAELLIALNQEKQPHYYSPKRPPNVQREAAVMDATIRLDGRNPEKMAEVIRWAKNDSFWTTNFYAATKLRERYGEWLSKMMADRELATRSAPAGN